MHFYFGPAVLLARKKSVRVVTIYLFSYLISAVGILEDVALLPAKNLSGILKNLSQGAAEDVSS
jgi:hypothetical protein